MCLQCCRGSPSPPSTAQQPEELARPVASVPISHQPVATKTPVVPKSSPSQVDVSKQPAAAKSVTPQVEQQPQIPAVPGSLPSQVDETLAACPRLRIVLVGKSGIGKSSLIANIFNIDIDKIDIAHDRAGEADIEFEYTSQENHRLVLHDSKGFEAGSEGNWRKVEEFLKTRQKNELPGRIHAIWFCVETPRTGARLLERGDEKLLQLAKDLEIPIIAVLTKYDILVTEFYRKDKVTAEDKASDSVNHSIKDLQGIPCIKVSMKEPDAKQMLTNLTKATRKELRGVEQELEVLWVMAQRVNARQKVEVSISEGFKKYWLDLGQSSAFQGEKLIDCIHRLHDDVLKVWNVNDQDRILSGAKFFTEMIGLVKPLIEGKDDEILSRVPSYGTGGAEELVHLLQSFGLSDSAIYYLYSEYQQYPSTAKLLATCIVNLILILHGVFTDTLPLDPPRLLTNDVVFKVVKRHKSDLEKETLDSIHLDPEFADHPEKVIERVIIKRLPLDSGV